MTDAFWVIRSFAPSKKNGHGNGCRQHPNSYDPNSFHVVYIYIYLIHQYSTGRNGPRRSPGDFGVGACVGPRRSPDALCVRLRRSLALCVGVPALSVSGPGGLCVGVPALSVSVFRRSLCQGPAVSVSGSRRSLCRSSGALCVRARRSLCRGPGALCVGLPALSVSGPGGLCVGVPALSVSVFRRSLCQGPAVSVSGSRRSLCRSSGGLCVGSRRSGPGALSLSVSGSVSAWRRPAALCVGLCRALCVGPRRSLSGVSGPALSVSGPVCRSLCGAPALGPALPAFWRSLCRGPAVSVAGPPPATIRVPPIRLRAPSSDPRATHPARRVPFFQDRTYCLEENSTMVLPPLLQIDGPTLGCPRI